MEFEEVMKELKTLGTAQNRKVYKRHGAGENSFGVSYANLNKLKKKIKTDTALAKQLWSSGNIDARTLATMIADPKQIKKDLLDSWVKDIKYYALVDSFVKNLVSKTDYAKSLMEKWMKSKDEWVGRAGWQLFAIYSMQDQSLPDNYYMNYLTIIEKDIHDSKNRTKDAMNNALIAIGSHNDSLKNKALVIADRIGKIGVDHGETSCKTPLAKDYIIRTWKHKEKKFEKD